ncbi:MAG: recombinase RecT [Clostridia bacterium]|nr:recombinase RecT [Clostridia bacterium]
MAQISNSLAPTQTKNTKLTFSQALETDGYKKLLASSIQDPKRRARFVTAVVSAVSANPTLQRCDAKSIISSALQGEALELSPSPALGEYWIIPYRVGKADFAHPENDVYQAQFQLGVAGRIQLAMRTGEYADIDTVEIREGEYLGRDSRNGKPKFRFIEDENEREQKPIIGYLAYFELLNGFCHSVYFPKEKVLSWADRYSKAFDRKLYERYIKGEVKDWKELQKCSSPWYETFDKMAENTVLKQCLKRGPKSIEMRAAEEKETEIENENAISDTFSVSAPEDDFFDGSDAVMVMESESDAEKEEVKTPEKKGKKTAKADDPPVSFFDS